MGTKLQKFQDDMKALNEEYVKKVKDAGIHEGETDIEKLKVGADDILKLKEESKEYQAKIQAIQVEHNKLYKDFEPLSKEVHELHEQGKTKSGSLHDSQTEFEAKQKTANDNIAKLEAHQNDMKTKHENYNKLKEEITRLKNAAEGS